jgi:hypothetical protein
MMYGANYKKYHLCINMRHAEDGQGQSDYDSHLSSQEWSDFLGVPIIRGTGEFPSYNYRFWACIEGDITSYLNAPSYPIEDIQWTSAESGWGIVRQEIEVDEEAGTVRCHGGQCLSARRGEAHQVSYNFLGYSHAHAVAYKSIHAFRIQNGKPDATVRVTLNRRAHDVFGLEGENNGILTEKEEHTTIEIQLNSGGSYLLMYEWPPPECAALCSPGQIDSATRVWVSNEPRGAYDHFRGWDYEVNPGEGVTLDGVHYLGPPNLGSYLSLFSFRQMACHLQPQDRTVRIVNCEYI